MSLLSSLRFQYPTSFETIKCKSNKVIDIAIKDAYSRASRVVGVVGVGELAEHLPELLELVSLLSSLRFQYPTSFETIKCKSNIVIDIAIKDAYSRASRVVGVGELAELVALPISYNF